MSLTGLVARQHAITNFDRSAYHAAGVATGSGSYTAFAAFRIMDLAEPATDLVIAGNKSGDDGWLIGRAGNGRDTADVIFLVASVGNAVVYFPLLRSDAVGRTFIVEIVAESGTMTVYLNGGFVAQVPATISSSDQDLWIGGGLSGYGYLIELFAVIAAGYTSAPDTAFGAQTIWDNFRQYSLFPEADFEFVWSARVLFPQNGTGVDGPDPWVNSGTSGAAGNLDLFVATGEGGVPNHNFNDDMCASFGQLSLNTTQVNQAIRGYRTARTVALSGDFIEEDAGGRLTVLVDGTTQTIPAQADVPWLKTDRLTVIVLDGQVTIAGPGGLIPANGLTLTSKVGPCVVHIDRLDDDDAWLAYGDLEPGA